MINKVRCVCKDLRTVLPSPERSAARGRVSSPRTRRCCWSRASRSGCLYNKHCHCHVDYCHVIMIIHGLLLVIVITWTHAVVVESSAGGEVAQLLRGGRRVVHHRRPQTRHRQLRTNIFFMRNIFCFKTL